MKLLVQGWLLALVLISELVGLGALAKHYYTQTPPLRRPHQRPRRASLS
jgi:hypothetical protein